jgi:hypothetical protein
MLGALIYIGGIARNGQSYDMENDCAFSCESTHFAGHFPQFVRIFNRNVRIVPVGFVSLFLVFDEQMRFCSCVSQVESYEQLLVRMHFGHLYWVCLLGKMQCFPVISAFGSDFQEMNR